MENREGKEYVTFRMPDEMIDSWNFYILFKRNDNVDA